MRKILITMVMAAGALVASAQAWEYNDEFKTDFLKSTPEVEFVDCNRGRMTAMGVQTCMRRDWMTYGANGTFINSKMTNTTGLYDKVAAGVAAARPKRSGGTSSSGGSKKMRGTGTYNYQTSDAHLQWVANKREQQREAARRAAEKKRQEAIARKIADDNRAAQVEAQTNARLQAQTNAAIARDHYHATEGAMMAQQRARRAARPRGPQFNRYKPTSTGADRASTLRGANKPRRVMHPQKRNAVRPTLPPVQRQPMTAERAQMLRKALQVRAELRRKREVERRLAQYKGFVLDEHAHSTLGQDWHSDDFKPQPIAPPPTSATIDQLTEEQRHQMIVEEMIDPALREIERQQRRRS